MLIDITDFTDQMLNVLLATKTNDVADYAGLTVDQLIAIFTAAGVADPRACAHHCYVRPVRNYHRAARWAGLVDYEGATLARQESDSSRWS